jgi:hypothetical protein
MRTQESERGGARATHEGEEKCTEMFVEKLKERGRLDSLAADRTALKRTLKK